MGCHKGDFIAPIFVVGNINITKERNVFKEIHEKHCRIVNRRDLGSILYLAVLNKLLDILAVPVIPERRYTVEKFLDIRGSGLAFDGSILLIKPVYPGFKGNRPGNSLRILF